MLLRDGFLKALPGHLSQETSFTCKFNCTGRYCIMTVASLCRILTNNRIRALMNSAGSRRTSSACFGRWWANTSKSSCNNTFSPCCKSFPPEVCVVWRQKLAICLFHFWEDWFSFGAPQWLVRQWLIQLGEEETVLLMECNNRRPTFALRYGFISQDFRKIVAWNSSTFSVSNRDMVTLIVNAEFVSAFT